MTTLETLISALIIGGTAGTGIIHLQDSATFATENLAGTITWQSDTVRIYQENFPQSAGPAVQQWAERKPVGQARLNALDAFAKSGNTAELEKENP